MSKSAAPVAAKFIRSMEKAKTVKDVNKIFNKVARLPAKKKAAVLSAFEEIEFKRFEQGATVMNNLGAGLFKERMSGSDDAFDAATVQLFVHTAQLHTQELVCLEELRGEKTPSFVKAFNKAAASLTEDERSTSAITWKPYLAAIEDFAAQKGAGNSKTAPAPGK